MSSWRFGVGRDGVLAPTVERAAVDPNEAVGLAYCLAQNHAGPSPSAEQWILVAPSMGQPRSIPS